MNPIERMSNAVSEGKTDSQYAIKDGKYVGDLFFITDSKHRILMGFVWTGQEWVSEKHVFNVSI